jgi:hypothetical protein
MWSPFQPIASLAAGLFSHLQQPFNITTSHGSMTALTPGQLAGFAPYTEFARAAYCDSSKIVGWNCGGMGFFILMPSQAYRNEKDACNALPGFLPTLTGGDGNDIQFCEHRFASTSHPTSWTL